MVCPLMARSNHSCRPNAEFVARIDKGTHTWSYYDGKSRIIMERANHSCRPNAEFVARVDKGCNDKKLQYGNFHWCLPCPLVDETTLGCQKSLKGTVEIFG